MRLEDGRFVPVEEPRKLTETTEAAERPPTPDDPRPRRTATSRRSAAPRAARGPTRAAGRRRSRVPAAARRGAVSVSRREPRTVNVRRTLPAVTTPNSVARTDTSPTDEAAAGRGAWRAGVTEAAGGSEATGPAGGETRPSADGAGRVTGGEGGRCRPSRRAVLDGEEVAAEVAAQAPADRRPASRRPRWSGTRSSGAGPRRAGQHDGQAPLVAPAAGPRCRERAHAAPGNGGAFEGDPIGAVTRPSQSGLRSTTSGLNQLSGDSKTVP